MKILLFTLLIGASMAGILHILPSVPLSPATAQAAPIFQNIFRTITQHLTREVPVQCPECPRVADVCAVGMSDTDDSGNFTLLYQCGGSFASCTVTETIGTASVFGGEEVALFARQVDGTGAFGLNIGIAPAITYKIYGQSGELCDYAVAHGAPSAGAPTRTFSPSIAQAAYRWFENDNSTDVGAAAAAQDTTYSPTLSSGDKVRLRMILNVTRSPLAQSGKNFTLQIANRTEDGAGTCGAVAASSWNDVSGATSFIFADNTPADGAALTANASDPTFGASAVIGQTYEEANDFSNSIAEIPAGRAAIWDFALEFNDFDEAVFCFRAVTSDNALLDAYSVHPEIDVSVLGD